MENVDALQNLLIGPMSGLASGWVIAMVFRGMYKEKDEQYRQAIQSTLDHLYEENKTCAERVNMLLREVLDMKTRLSQWGKVDAA